MKAWLATTALPFLLLAGCAAGDDDTVEPSHSDASPMGGSDAGIGGKQDGAVASDASLADAGGQDAGSIITLDVMPLPCSVNIRSVSTPDLNNLPAGPGLFVRLRGEIIGHPKPLAPEWKWRVSRSGEDITPPVAADDATLLRVPLERAGRYVVSVTVADGCTGETAITAETKDRVESYVVLRLIPPQTSSLPAQDSSLKLSASLAGNANIILADGKMVSIKPQRIAAQLGNEPVGVPSFIRVANSRSTFLREGIASPQFTTLLGPSRYDILVVPEDNQWPPLFESQVHADLLINRVVNVTAGVGVTGKITRNGTPVVGARVMLRKDQQPSTVGEVDAQGTYKLRARTGRHSVRIVGPADTSWPSIDVPAVNGVDLPEEDRGDVELNVSYTDMSPATLTLMLNRPDGAAPASGALVQVTSQLLNSVATLAVGKGQAFAVAGKVDLSTTATAAGKVTVAGLPRGIYTVKVRSPQAPAWGAAYQTTVNMDLRAGDGSALLNLSPAVLVTGKLNTIDESATDLRMVAINEADTTGAPEATAVVSANGTFVLRLSPQATYRLRVDPPLGRLFPRVVFGTIATEAQDKTLALNLPKTLRVTGRIANTQGVAVPGTIVQAFCTDLSADCIDASNPNVGLALPLSEAVAGPDGQFVLVLPDPGSS